MHNNQRIVMVVPCYNEEKGLEVLLNKTPPLIDEVVVVDNDSADRTAAVAREHGARVIFEKKRGYGTAYQAGLNALGNADIVVMMDGDNTIPPGAVEGFVRRMDADGYDFMSGCRFPLTDARAMPPIKQVSNRFFSWLIRKILRITLQDSQSGMMVFRRRILTDIMSLNPGMSFGMEFKLNAWLNPSIKCGELHIDYGIRTGKVKYRALQDGFLTITGLAGYLLRHKKTRGQ